MNRLVEATVRRRPWKGAALVLGLAVLVLSLLLMLNLETTGPGLVLTAVTAGAVLMLFVAAVTWHLAVRLARAQFGELLREARQQSQATAQLLTDWAWQTDAHHHLIRWQAPQGALASTWAGSSGAGSVTQRLWERFRATESGKDLERCAMTQQPFAGLQVVDEQGKSWVLRAQPILDAAGRFLGFLGAAQPGGAELALTADAAAVAGDGQLLRDVEAGRAGSSSPQDPSNDRPARADWLQALPGPAWLISGGRPQAQTLLIDCNVSAAQLMGGGDFAGQLWRACEERLPEEFRHALAQPELHSGSACGAWWLCLTPLPTGDCSLLSLWPQGAADTVPAALAMQAAEQARADQASFSYTVSHDLRAPLRVVEGFTRILKEDYGRLLDRAGNDHLDRVLGASSRMHTMIDALLALSQLSTQALRQETVDLSLLAQQVLDELRRSSPQRQVQISVQDGLRVQGDPTLLRMVLENLLGNAWKYSGQRELAVIRFEAAEQAPPGQRSFVVTDNGAGFDMRFADRLFGVFQRLHSASEFPGTGVGLASARRIVRRHGGDMWAESEAGQGARFYFSLPL